MQDAMITTALTLPGYRIVKNLGIVRGITVRSRSLVGNIRGALLWQGGAVRAGTLG